MLCRKLTFEDVNRQRENQIHLLENCEGKFLLGPLPCPRYLPDPSKRNQMQKEPGILTVKSMNDIKNVTFLL